MTAAPRSLYLDQPCEVSIETLTLCNAACGFCPYEKLTRKGTQMPDLLISRLIEEMSEFKLPFVFSPFKVNEPFLDPRLRAICETFLAKCTNGRLRLFTNGSALVPAQARWVADLARVEHLWISLNSTDPVEHQDLMQFKSPMYARIAHHLDILHNMIEREEFGHEVVVSRVAHDGLKNKKFMTDCVRRWPRFRVILIKKDAWLQDISAPEIPIPQAPCGRWWELSITATGKAMICCMAGEEKPEWTLGDVRERGLLEIYNAPAWKNRRAHLLNRHTVPICQTCSY